MTPTGTLPPSDWVAEQLGQTVADPIALLAGRARVAAPDRGELVCVCHDVHALDIEQAVMDGAGDVSAIGAACRAGTNCGSCRPILSRMLAEWENEIKEAAE